RFAQPFRRRGRASVQSAWRTSLATYRARGGRAGFGAGLGDLGGEGMRALTLVFRPMNCCRVVLAAVGTSIFDVLKRWHFGQTARQLSRLLSLELASRIR